MITETKKQFERTRASKESRLFIFKKYFLI